MATKYKSRYISTFYSDVLKVTTFLEEHPRKAARILKKIDKAMLDVIKMPELYPVYEDFPPFRKIAVEDYLVFYLINHNDNTIEVHRLVSSKMD
jgi:plasmid stabilization system protein ParE